MVVDIIIKCTINTEDVENIEELVARLESDDVTMEIDGGIDVAELTLENVSIEDV